MDTAEIVAAAFFAALAMIMVFAVIMGRQYERQRKEATRS